MSEPFHIVLAGNPNCGKTELFNALTGSKQRVGNWPGVTVEKKTGRFCNQNQFVDVVDLPGIYALTQDAESQGIDASITVQYLQDNHIDLVVNVVDASQLERHFYLTAQLTEQHVPMILAVNMMDMAEKKGIRIDFDRLSKELGCPVVGITAKKKIGIQALKAAICQQTRQKVRPRLITQWPTEMDRTDEDHDRSLINARAHYQAAHHLASSCQQQTASKQLLRQKLDKIVLNRFLGLPIFLGVMYLMFVFSINIGGAFQDFFDLGSDAIFVTGSAHLLQSMHAPTWVIAILSSGLGKGINTVLTFIPVIAAMFIFLALLEDSGYLARAAFVVDRVMQKLGLPGQSFVPMIVGFGCNVPAVMGTRTLSQPRDRILTILMIPFVSCGARLAIFAVFASAFFPHGGQNVIFLLYLLGIVAAMVTGFLIRKTLLPGRPAPLMMELPEYHLPTFQSIRKLLWQRLRGFLWRAGKLIIPICILIGSLNAIVIPSHTSGKPPETVLSAMGKTVTPLFAPMGIQPDNWPATVGLATGVLAKEVVIATLNTLYSQTADILSHESLATGLKQAALSIPANFANLSHAFSNPLAAAESDHSMSTRSVHTMVALFQSPLAAFCYLIFVLLYFPCISTLAAMRREIPTAWSTFSMLWTTGLAYGTAVAVYQIGTIQQHVTSSLTWLGSIFITLVMTVWVLKKLQRLNVFIIPTHLNRPSAANCTGCQGCESNEKIDAAKQSVIG